MREFRDKSGSTWQIELTIGDVLRVKTASEGRFNLLDPESQPGGECGDRQLNSVVNCDDTADYAALWELLFLLVEPQAKERGLDASAFAQLMPPENLVAGQQALLKEWADFFHRLQRPDKGVALEKMAAYHGQAMQKVKAVLAGTQLQELDARVDAEMDAALKSSFGNLLENWGSTLADSPTGNSG